MLIGPLRLSRYCSPMRALPHQELAKVLSVGTPRTLYTERICKWSCKLAPTPGSSCTTSMPCWCSSAPGPMQLQQLRRVHGPGAQQHLARGAHRHQLLPLHTCTPVQRWRWPSAWRSVSKRVAWAEVHIAKFARP